MTNRQQQIGFSFLFGVLGIMLTGYAVFQIISVWLFHQKGHITEAQVTNWKTIPDGHTSSNRYRTYLIRYTFVVNGVDVLPPANLWMPVPEDVWHETYITRKIDVR